MFCEKFSKNFQKINNFFAIFDLSVNIKTKKLIFYLKRNDEYKSN